MNSHNVRFIQEARVGDTAYALCFDFDRCLWLAEVHLRAGSEVYLLTRRISPAATASRSRD